MSSTISVQLDALDALAGELTALAGELHDDADRCSTAGAGLSAGLTLDECLTAVWAASAWAVLARAVADGTQAVAAALSAAVIAYRAAERLRGQAIARNGSGYVAAVW